MKTSQKAKLGDICTIKTGKLDSNAAVDGGKYPFFTCAQETFSIDKFAFDTEAVLLGGNNANGIFPLKYYQGKFNAYQRTYIIESKDRTKVLDKFVYFSLRPVLDYFKSASIGAATQYLTKPLLDNLKINLPDVDTQRSIIDIVYAYDDLITTNRRRIHLLEESARLLFREWFVYFRFPRLRQGFGGQAGHEKACPVESINSTGVKIVDGLPEGWASQPIATISDCVGGGTPSTSMPAYWVDGDITWVTPTDVTRNKHFILLDSEKKITEAGLQNSSAKLVPAHTVLMTSRASVGFFAIANREVCTNQGFISIVPHDAVFSLFLLFQLSERVEEIRAMGSGSTYPEVSRGKFRDFKVIIPPKKLVSDFDEQASFCFKQISNLKQQNQKLAQARDLLLPRLMSGAIEV